MLSYTGESEEIKKLMPVLKTMGVRIIAMTGKPAASAWRGVDVVINCAVSKEACPFNLAPTSSTAAMLALGDALALSISERKGFKRETLARFHPGGGIGKQLTVRVKDIMRTGKDNAVVKDTALVKDALIVMTKTRLGATNIVNNAGKLIGFFTDGDLRRWLQKDPRLLERRISTIMTHNPLTIGPDILASEAAEVLRKHRFDNIPVVDTHGVPVGVLDERDLLAEGIA